MQVPSLGTIGSLAATPLAQRSAETDKAQHDAEALRQAQHSLAAAEQASGIGQTQEESEASERDADGRRLWEEPVRKQPATPGQASEETLTPPPDPTGQCGTQLDLLG
jgi:type II secretory pathway pseudopilin PulG